MLIHVLILCQIAKGVLYGRGLDRHPYLPTHRERHRFKYITIIFIKEMCDLFTLNNKRIIVAVWLKQLWNLTWIAWYLSGDIVWMFRLSRD